MEMEIRCECPMCGAVGSITLNEDEAAQFTLYQMGFGYIQDLHTLNPAEREFLKSGYCPSCMEMLFGNSKTDRISMLG